jgi:MFS transporter, ACS family, allantoate permease
MTAGVFFQNMTNTLQNSFNGLIIKGFGFNTYEAVLLTLPVGAIFGISCLTITWILGTKWGQGKRCFTLMICYCPGLISTVLLYRFQVSDSTLGVLLFAIMFLNIISTCAAVMYSLLASNIAGYTKKVCGRCSSLACQANTNTTILQQSVVNSIFFIAYSLGNIVSPQAFLQTEAPRYQTGIAVTLASFVINIILFGCLYLVYRWENNRRDKAAEGQPELSEDEKTRIAFSDLTDNENKAMRYMT